MLDGSKIRVVVRNTFLDTVVGMESEARACGGSRLRHRSSPPISGRAGSPERNSQLERLNALFAGVQSLSDEEAHVGVEAEEPWVGCAPRGWTCDRRGPLTVASPSSSSESGGDALKGLRAAENMGIMAEELARPDAPSESERSPAPALTDVSGGLVSIGSAGHSLGTCRPCAYVRSRGGCRLGVLCEFCHFVGEQHSEPRIRPGKGKRERIKKAMSSLEEQVARTSRDSNSASSSGAAVRIPRLVALNPCARNRVAARLQQLAADATGEVRHAAAVGATEHP